VLNRRDESTRAQRRPDGSLPQSAPRELSSAELFGAETEILIVHEEARYRLRITRQNKLILTK